MRYLLLAVVFLLIACNGNSHPKKGNSTVFTGWYFVTGPENGVKVNDTWYKRSYYIDPQPILTDKNFTTFDILDDTVNHGIILSIQFDNEGIEKFSKATKQAIGKQLAFLLFDKTISLPRVDAQITKGPLKSYLPESKRDEIEEIKKKLGK